MPMVTDRQTQGRKAGAPPKGRKAVTGIGSEWTVRQVRVSPD